MEFDLKTLAAFLTETGLMQKSFVEMNKTEILHFCEQVHCATTENTGWRPPYLNKNNELVIPHDAPLKYRYWMLHGGQSLKKILIEIGASEEIMARYVRDDAGGEPHELRGENEN